MGYITTVNMAKCPNIVMQIPRNKFLSWWLHSEILWKDTDYVRTIYVYIIRFEFFDIEGCDFI